jgi:hypothetical protein|tara:strand:- start:101 stop:364 length:264 start_codon:yes stop_codon:yes gene_type:complete
MFKKLKITCDEATTICDKSQYNEASFFEKIQLNWHLFNCKLCSLYVKQNRKMTSLFQMKSADCKEETKCLSKMDKEAFKKELEKLEV